jgi:hypothetical protein
MARLAIRPQRFLNLHFVSNDHWTKDEGLFILKTMIIGHRMKLFILMPGGSGLPTPDMLRGRSISQEFFT